MKYKLINITPFLKTVMIFIIPNALILNWALSFNWIVEESCVDVFGNPTTAFAEGFPFPSMIEHVCTHEWLGVGYKAINYWLLFLNGIIKIGLATLLYYFIQRKFKFNLWQIGLWLFFCYILFGTNLYAEFKEVHSCGEFSYVRIDEIKYNLSSRLYGLSDYLLWFVFYYWYFFIIACLGLSVLIWSSYRRATERYSKWWFIFYVLWVFLFAIILLFETYLYRLNDQLITSSGDCTYRQQWYSILIGYAVLIYGFIISKKVIVKYLWKGILGAVCIFCLSICILIKNQHCIVLGTSGMRFVEFYTPFYENEYIGEFMENAKNPLQDLGEGKWNGKNITKINTQSNKIIFTRPLSKDYLITKQFLFWRFDFPDEFHD